jgi:hypothetical protein
MSSPFSSNVLELIAIFRIKLRVRVRIKVKVRGITEEVRINYILYTGM